jgi:hypothetical protein
MVTCCKVGSQGVWILPVCLFISGMAILPESPYRAWMQHVLDVPQSGDSPMRFLRKDVAIGASATSGLVLILLLGAFVSTKSWYWTSVAYFASWMVLGFPIAKALVILWRCFDLMDDSGKANAVYYDNELFDRTFFTTYCFGGVLGALFSVIGWLRFRRSKGPSGITAAGSPS